MNNNKTVKALSREFILAIIMLCILIITATTATFAWFSGNKTVNTTHVSARTGVDTVELQISRSLEHFLPEEDCPIVQVNDTDYTKLLPVSTTDLKTFVYNNGNISGNAIAFEKVENEERIYHGRVYLRAYSDSDVKGKMALYLDANDGKLVSAADGAMLNAVRLGLIINDDPKTTVIFKNDHVAKQSNTIFEGKDLAAGQVLGMTGDNIFSAADPAVLLSTYSIILEGENSRLPEKELFTMELNHIYPVDIYFYLEGCDGDCVDSISLKDADLKLAFYGVLTD